MRADEFFADRGELDRDLELIESLHWAKKEFFDRICEASRSQEADVLDMLRLESSYQLADFYYLIAARRIEAEADVKRWAELHNEYIVQLSKDQGKMLRFGLHQARLLDAMFTSDTLPRLLHNWRDRPGAIDQSNLARFLVTVMSTETCRKAVVASTKAGFLNREKTPYGTVLIVSNGILERVFGGCMRDLRHRLEGAHAS